MTSRNAVEFADRLSRRKPAVLAFAALWFLAIQPFTRPMFDASGGARAMGWAFNAAVILVLLLPVKGFVWGRQVRELINDDVSRFHARSAMSAGFWLAMGIALGLFVLPFSRTLSAREAIYYVVTASAGGALLLFSWLEWRANRDG